MSSGAFLMFQSNNIKQVECSNNMSKGGGLGTE